MMAERVAMALRGLDGRALVALGLGGAESPGRAASAATRGLLYQGADRTWYCCPLARWSVADVWGYVASRALVYSAAYDAMTALGVPRDAQRVSTLLGAIAATTGRHELVRAIEPETFRALVAEFPGLRRV